MKKMILIVVLLLTLTGCTLLEEDFGDSTEIIEISNVDNDELLSEMFTERDLEQDVTEYDDTLQLVSNEDILITEEGTYLILGDVSNSTIVVNADDEVNVQLVLSDVSIVNDDMPAIYVISADKVFVTLVGDNYLEVNGTTTVDESNLDAAIFSKDDLVINGEGSIEIVSITNGITSKDDLKITGGTILITSLNHGLEANDSIRIYDGDITIESGNDALHSENEEEDLGYVYISGGTITITSEDDAIRANTYVRVDGGEITILDSYEGIEATVLYINGGVIDLYASDDGLNATQKSNLDVEIYITGGAITIEVGTGDTDGIDSNGDLTITGGIVSITAPTSSIDVDGTVTHTSGRVIVNGVEVEDASEISSSGGGSKRK